MALYPVTCGSLNLTIANNAKIQSYIAVYREFKEAGRHADYASHLLFPTISLSLSTVSFSSIVLYCISTNTPLKQVHTTQSLTFTQTHNTMDKKNTIHTHRADGYAYIENPNTGTRGNVSLGTHAIVNTQDNTAEVSYTVHISVNDLKHLSKGFDFYFEAVNYYNQVVDRYAPNRQDELEQAAHESSQGM